MNTQLIAATAFAFVSTLPAVASTYVVDDSGGPGVDFTDLQTAINSAAPGDVLLVRPGYYGAFTLDKGLTLLSDSSSQVNALARITGVPAGERATVVGLYFVKRLEVQSCPGAVVCVDIGVWGSPAVSIASCADVRIHDSGFLGGSSGIGVKVDASRVEITSSTIFGGDGVDSPNADTGSPGGAALRCENASRVDVVSSSLYGGDGGDACYGFCGGGFGGDAAPGILAWSSTMIVAGSGTITGGKRGAGNYPGQHAPGISWAGSSLRWSSASISGGGTSSTGHAPPIVPPVAPVSPPDPTLTIAGNAMPGGTVTLTFHGVSGTNGRLQQGNQMLVDDDGLATIEKLNNRIRIHPLGPVPSSGTISYPLIVPSNWVPGQFRVFQGLEIDAPTAMLLERTNSVPVVVH